MERAAVRVLTVLAVVVILSTASAGCSNGVSTGVAVLNVQLQVCQGPPTPTTRATLVRLIVQRAGTTVKSMRLGYPWHVRLVLQPGRYELLSPRVAPTAATLKDGQSRSIVISTVSCI